MASRSAFAVLCLLLLSVGAMLGFWLTLVETPAIAVENPQDGSPLANSDSVGHIVGVDGDEYLTPEEQRNIAVYENCYRSVVHISTQAVQIDRFFRKATQEEGSGSGSIIDAQGHILTNYHVIEGADRLNVTLFDGKQFEAKLVGQDPPNDMAVIKIEASEESLIPLQLGKSLPLRVGQKVYAIGSPFGLERSMTVGVVSSLGRNVPTHNHRVLKSMIQVDAALNQGNSGGPLLDSRGLLVGMNTAIATSTGENTGVGFAIPVDTIRRVATSLIRDGRVVRPSLGIAAYIQSDDGLVIGQLVPGGPAEQAGLRGVRIIRRRSYFGEQRQVDIGYADVILAVEGQPVKTLDDLMSVIERLKPSQLAKLTILRDGKAVPVEITLGDDADE